jgi:birA, biotin-[acetyl-CoA-carboxylase] ligase region
MQFGTRIERFEEVGSTQDVARERALAGAAPGTVVAAERMTAGRGRQGRAWHSPPGANVCLTAIGEPVPAADAWQVALVGGVAACRTVRETVGEDIGAFVRYPNDVLLGGRKVCGVLVETVGAPTPPRAVLPLIGIGINVRAPEAALPSEVAAVATSLEGETGRRFDVRAVEAALLRHLSAEWDLWRAYGFGALVARWKPLLAPDARRAFTLDGAGAPVECRILDLDAAGMLTLELPDGGGRRILPAALALAE